MTMSESDSSCHQEDVNSMNHTISGLIEEFEDLGQQIPEFSELPMCENCNCNLRYIISSCKDGCLMYTEVLKLCRKSNRERDESNLKLTNDNRALEHQIAGLRQMSSRIKREKIPELSSKSTMDDSDNSHLDDTVSRYVSRYENACSTFSKVLNLEGERSRQTFETNLKLENDNRALKHQIQDLRQQLHEAKLLTNDNGAFKHQIADLRQQLHEAKLKEKRCLKFHQLQVQSMLPRLRSPAAFVTILLIIIIIMDVIIIIIQ